MTQSARATEPAPSRAISALPWLAALAAVAVHLGALRNRLALDDASIVAHPLIQSVRTLPAALASPWWYDTRHLYRPLSLVSLGLDRAVGGGAPWVSHAVNLALHAGVAAVAVLLARRWLPAFGALVTGLAVALLPVHAEAVSGIVGRAELLSAMALMALMLLVTREAPPTARARILAAALAAAALGAKETGVAAPLLALAAAMAMPRQRVHARTWATSALIGTLVLLAARLYVLGTLGGDQPHPYFRALPAGTRAGIALSLIPRAGAMLFLPVLPAVEEVPPLARAQHLPLASAAVGVGLLLLTLALMLRHMRRPTPLTLGSWILGATIAPTSNLLFASGVVLTARTLYAPSLGAALMLGALAARLAGTRWRVPAAAALAALGVVGAGITWRETRVWRDSPSVVRTMLARAPDDYRGHEYAAYAARDAGRLDESARHFARAIALFPRDAELATDAATVALRLPDSVLATRWLETALAASPRAARARTRLFALLRARGDTLRARRLLTDGLRLEPGQRTWATLLARSGATDPRAAR